MKRSIAAGLAAAVIAVMTFPVAARATETTPTCGMPAGWYANPDEQDRLPEPASAGLKFHGKDDTHAGNALIHHAADTTVEALTHGTFTASPAPDQESFFSVEVSGSDGGYGTLRWNTTTSKWNLVTGGQFYENTDPAKLVDMPPAHRSHHVVSFGVGYTANPPGTVTTVVSSVSFGGKTYDLTCKPAPSSSSASPSTSASASASASVSSNPSASGSSSPAAGAVTTTSPAVGGGLAITGPGTALIVAGALVTLGAGIVLFVFTRRRRVRFTA